MLRCFIVIFLLFPVFSLQALEQDFFVKVRSLTDQFTHKREGLVIWTDLSNSQTHIFGNQKWADEKMMLGSIFKLIVAQSAIEKGLDFKYECAGKDKLRAKERHCWTYRGHGKLDLPKALAISCNLYFQNLGFKLGFSQILETLNQYPALRNGKTLLKPESAFDLGQFSIGDDPAFRLTPRQVSQFWNEYVLKLQEAKYAAIFQGLRRTVSQEGTASRLKNSPLEILAKTGTSDSLNSNYETNAWFLGAYPAKDPQYTLLILLQEAHGFEEASRLAEKIFSKL